MRAYICFAGADIWPALIYPYNLRIFFMHTNTHTLNILGGTWTFWEFPLRMRSATVLEGDTICTHHDGQFYWLSTAN